LTLSKSEALPIETKRPRATLGVGTKCKGICNRYSLSIRKYISGEFKRCSTCDIFLFKVYDKCPCCNLKLRTQPKDPKDKNTRKGNEAFYKYDALMIRAKNEFRLISKIPGETKKIKKTIHNYLEQAIIQYEIMDQEQRLRPVYLKAKIKSMLDFLEKLRQV